MAVLVFLIWGKFRKCFSQRRQIKYWVVAEAAGATRRVQDFPIRTVTYDCDGPPIFHYRDDTTEIRATLRRWFT